MENLIAYLEPYTALILAWSGYYFIHSLLASDMIKNKIVGRQLTAQGYRKVYNLIALTGLAPVIYLMMVAQKHYLIAPGWWNVVPGIFITVFSLWFLKKAFKPYHTQAFLGFADASLESQQLVTKGFQKYVRHPLYTGTLMFFAGLFITKPTLSMAIILIITFIYILIGIQLEESRLVRQFGEQYKSYQKNKPMLFTWKWW